MSEHSGYCKQKDQTGTLLQVRRADVAVHAAAAFAHAAAASADRWAECVRTLAGAMGLAAAGGGTAGVFKLLGTAGVGAVQRSGAPFDTSPCLSKARLVVGFIKTRFPNRSTNLGRLAFFKTASPHLLRMTSRLGRGCFVGFRKLCDVRVLLNSNMPLLTKKY